MRTAFEHVASRSDDENHQDLRAKRFDKPPCLKQLLVGLKHDQHDVERQEIEHRTDRSNHKHEITDEMHIEYARFSRFGGIHFIQRDGQLRNVVKNIVEQDLRRQHRQERQKQ